MVRSIVVLSFPFRNFLFVLFCFKDKRLALKARLFKTLGSTVNLLRIYSYNAKVAPVLLTLLKIYAKNGEFLFTRSCLFWLRFKIDFILRTCFRVNSFQSVEEMIRRYSSFRNSEKCSVEVQKWNESILMKEKYLYINSKRKISLKSNKPISERK